MVVIQSPNYQGSEHHSVHLEMLLCHKAVKFTHLSCSPWTSCWQTATCKASLLPCPQAWTPLHPPVSGGRAGYFLQSSAAERTHRYEVTAEAHRQSGKDSESICDSDKLSKVGGANSGRRVTPDIRLQHLYACKVWYVRSSAFRCCSRMSGVTRRPELAPLTIEEGYSVFCWFGPLDLDFVGSVRPCMLESISSIGTVLA
jgi:hypothetical protein